MKSPAAHEPILEPPIPIPPTTSFELSSPTPFSFQPKPNRTFLAGVAPEP